MFSRLAEFVARRWLFILTAWVVVVLVLRQSAPTWESITHDGDFAYLPDTMPSVVGDRWMAEAFPLQRAKSQIAVAVVRDRHALTADDMQVAYDVARRMKNLYGASRLAAARKLAESEAALRRQSLGSEADRVHVRYLEAVEEATRGLEDAARLDESLARYWDKRITAAPGDRHLRPRRLAEVFHNQALLDTLLGQTEAAAKHRQTARQLNEGLEHAGQHVLPQGADRLPLVDSWTWQDSYFGDKLISRDRCVRLVVLQLSNEFMAVDNIGVLRQIEAELHPVRQMLAKRTVPGLTIVQSGSAAVGADMLRAAAAGIKNTELFTVVLVVLILALVYRAPLLVAVPIATIVISLLASTSLVALLTQLSNVPGFQWWTLKVFSTTRIFIVVILFGAGTDFCLFLISRYKEELQAGKEHVEAVVAALTHVGDALAASALTTILGLSMMFFADFGKFCYSGPVIGLCLAIALLTCITLTPALLCGLGPLLFWPFGVPKRPADDSSETLAAMDGPVTSRLAGTVWRAVARVIVGRPGNVLLICVAVLFPFACFGWMHRGDVTYDFLSSLPAAAPSRQGTLMLRRHFPVGESGPVTVLVHRRNARFESPAGRDMIRSLSDQLHLPGVRTVRSSEDPLGEYAPGEKPGIISGRGRRLRVLRAHPRTKAIFVAQVPELAGDVARLELVLNHDPFSVAALGVVERVEQKLATLTRNPRSFWHDARFALTGTSAAIRDLRLVTRNDNARIQILVVLAVLIVLLLILRRPAVCLYMMLSVLFSYYVTLGITTLFFSWMYGESYQGLDWKVPLFLFVILVAVGQDYNVYLVTRVIEEQTHRGPFAGLRRAVVCTGGIITSCGVIMAGTFLSMTSGAWGTLLPASFYRVPLPPQGALKSIVELGFALALGVLLDTLVVRPVLLPAFLALLCRLRLRRGRMPVN